MLQYYCYQTCFILILRWIQNLKQEVEWMGSMSRCMDSFLTTHTRLVVIVDGLDSCEQEKLLQVIVISHGFQTAKRQKLTVWFNMVYVCDKQKVWQSLWTYHYPYLFISGIGLGTHVVRWPTLSVYYDTRCGSSCYYQGNWTQSAWSLSGLEYKRTRLPAQHCSFTILSTTELQTC